MSSPALEPKVPLLFPPQSPTELTGAGEPVAIPDKERRESNENRRPEQANGALNKSKPRRASESGIPTGRATPRRSSGTGQTSSPAPKLTPRDTRSSSLRKSLSGAENTSLRAASASSPNAAGFELNRLRDDLSAKQKEADKLGDEVATLKGLLSSKERALSKYTADHDSLNSRLLKAEGQLGNKLRELRELEAERNKLRAANQDLERQADRLTRKLGAQPKGTGFSEAIATLEAEVKGLQLDNTKLSDNAKGAQNQVRAKDKQLDNMAAEVDEARRICIQNGELENYILDLRRQLQESANERATLVNIQRQAKTDMAILTEERDAANRNADQTERELKLCTTQLKAAEENAAELNRELELRKAELQRVTTVASRAIHREAKSIREDGTVPFNQHKEEVMHLKGELSRLKEKLRLEEKSSAATQQQMRQLYSRIDALQGKNKANGNSRSVEVSPKTSPQTATAPEKYVADTSPTKANASPPPASPA